MPARVVLTPVAPQAITVRQHGQCITAWTLNGTILEITDLPDGEAFTLAVSL